jgi:Zn-dependent protease with chaperone function/LysM repeat protein
VTAKSGAARSSPLLAATLLSGIYILVLFLFLLAAALFVPLIVALGGHVNYFVALLSEVAAVGSVPGLVIIFYGVFALKRSADDRAAIEVSPDQAPRLWAAVHEAATAVGTRPPNRLRVAALANATVAEETRLLGFAAGRRDLTIGMPLLLGVSADELRAVLAHEMGHYARGHTRLGARVYRGSVALHNTCRGLRVARETDSRQLSIRGLSKITSLYVRLAYGALSAYSTFYDRVSFAARRRQELQADAYAAENFGRQVTASALRAAHALPVAWTRFRDGYLEPMRKAGYVSDDPFGAFEAMLDDPGYRDVLAELWQSPPQGPISPLDSHPTLAQRLAALAALGTATPAARPGGSAARAATELLTDDQRRDVSRRLGRAMFPAETEPNLSWQEWVGIAATLSATEPAKDLLRAAGHLAAAATATLHTVLDALEADRGGQLEHALRDGRTLWPRAVPAGRALLDAALFALIGQYLVAAGRAEWTASWTGPGTLIAADIAADELPDLVAAAIGRPVTEVARLRLHLAALGIEPTAAVPAEALVRVHSRDAARPTVDVSIKPLVNRVAAEFRENMRVLTILVAALVGVLAVVGNVESISARSRSDAGVSVPADVQAYQSQGQSQGQSQPQGLWTDPAPSPYRTPSLGFEDLPPIDWGLLLQNLAALPGAKAIPVTSITVRSGDTLSALACRYQTTVRVLQEINGLGKSSRILAGQHLRVPMIPGPDTSSAC